MARNKKTNGSAEIFSLAEKINLTAKKINAAAEDPKSIKDVAEHVGTIKGYISELHSAAELMPKALMSENAMAESVLLQAEKSHFLAENSLIMAEHVPLMAEHVPNLKKVVNNIAEIVPKLAVPKK